MNSIRVRIALVLVASITLVVCLATGATIFVTRQTAFESFVRPIAKQLDLITRLLPEPGPTGRLPDALTAAPAAGEPRTALTARLRADLLKLGNDRPVMVTRQSGADPLASIEIVPGRWLSLPIEEEPPPREAWLFLGGWVLVILLGTTGIALVVAYRVTQPLVLLESFAARLEPGSEIDRVPETGPVEVRATARALNTLNHKLRLAVESRMRLVAAAGHDLRTPLTRMRLRAEFLDESERDKWLHNLDELERIADSAILLVREEAGGRDREELRLDHLIHDIAAELDGIHLSVRIGACQPVTIVGPPLALTRAFRNLVVNAATHGGGAEVSVGVRDGKAYLMIEDRGPGIPDDLLDRVFEPFFRVDQSRRRSVPGAGLGLAIAREIIGRAGGELILKSRTGGGLQQSVSFAGSVHRSVG